MPGEHAFPAGGPIDGHDLAVAPGGRQDHYDGGPGRGQAGDHAVRAADERMRRTACRVDRVQMAAATVAHAEEGRAGVIGGPGRGTGAGRAARHHIAVEVTRQVDRGAAVQGHPQQADVSRPGAGAPDDQQGVTFRGPGDGLADARTAAHEPGPRTRLVFGHVHDVGLGAQRALGGGAAGDAVGQTAAVGRPGRNAGVPVPVGDLPNPAVGEVEDMQMAADRAHEATTDDIVIKAVHHDRWWRRRPGMG